MSQPSDPNARASHGVATRLSHAGRSLSPDMPFVNVPVVRASTVLFEDVAAMHGPDTKYHYGRRGTPTSEALTDAMNELEGAAGTVLAPSGLAAISVALLSCLSAGDHLLVTDTAYRPTRNVCNGVLKRMGIETTYFDPALGAGVEALFKPNTKAIFTEAPGSLTFEMMDIPAIAEVAHRHGATVLMDNTWATPLFFKPLDHGVDISLMAATKYVVGHSDAMIGTVSANARAWPALRSTSGDLGMFTGPDDMWLALRGLRTMAVRLERHQTSTLAVTRWMETHPAVERVLYPALESDPGHALWKRDFCGASGLFGAILKPCSKAAVAAMLDGLELFGLGYSWGGFESLAIPCDMSGIRTATPWDMATPLVRFHIGLEDPKDLIADLAKGFERLMVHD